MQKLGRRRDVTYQAQRHYTKRWLDCQWIFTFDRRQIGLPAIKKRPAMLLTGLFACVLLYTPPKWLVWAAELMRPYQGHSPLQFGAAPPLKT